MLTPVNVPRVLDLPTVVCYNLLALIQESSRRTYLLFQCLDLMVLYWILYCVIKVSQLWTSELLPGETQGEKVATLRHVPNRLEKLLLKSLVGPLEARDKAHLLQLSHLPHGSEVYLPVPPHPQAGDQTPTQLANDTHILTVEKGRWYLRPRQDLIYQRISPCWYRVTLTIPSWVYKPRPRRPDFSHSGEYAAYLAINDVIWVAPSMVTVPHKLLMYLAGQSQAPPNVNRLTQSILASVNLNTPCGLSMETLLEFSVAYLRYLKTVPVDLSVPDKVDRPEQWIAPLLPVPTDPACEIHVGMDFAPRPFQA